MSSYSFDITFFIAYSLQDTRNSIIAIVPVGLGGNWENAAGAADGLKAVGSLAVNNF